MNELLSRNLNYGSRFAAGTMRRSEIVGWLRHDGSTSCGLEQRVESHNAQLLDRRRRLGG